MNIAQNVNDIIDARGARGYVEWLKQLGRVYTFGGLPRDCYLGRPELVGDIDLVVDTTPYALNQLMGATLAPPEKNAFGGWKVMLHNPSWGDKTNELDVWPLMSTWSIRRGLAPSLWTSANLSFDNICVDLTTSSVAKMPGYELLLNSGTVDLVLEKTPNKKMLAQRTRRLTSKRGLTMSPRLLAFVEKNDPPTPVDENGSSGGFGKEEQDAVVSDPE